MISGRREISPTQTRIARERTGCRCASALSLPLPPPRAPARPFPAIERTDGRLSFGRTGRNGPHYYSRRRRPRDNAGPKYRRSAACLRLKIRPPPFPPRRFPRDPPLRVAGFFSSSLRAPPRPSLATFSSRTRATRGRERGACRSVALNDSRRGNISERSIAGGKPPRGAIELVGLASDPRGGRRKEKKRRRQDP